MIVSEQHKRLIKKLLDAVRYDYGHWARTVMYRECFKMVRQLDPSRLDVLEVSAGSVWRGLGFKSFTEANFPAFDLCSMTLPRTFDLIIADQVFEHLLWPYRAGKNARAMLKPGGHVLITTPFLIKVHEVPVDCTRWTELGLKHLLAECGFSRGHPYRLLATVPVSGEFRRLGAARVVQVPGQRAGFPVSVWRWQ
jgi:SAM-dependent methyltransferase